MHFNDSVLRFRCFSLMLFGLLKKTQVAPKPWMFYLCRYVNRRWHLFYQCSALRMRSSSSWIKNWTIADFFKAVQYIFKYSVHIVFHWRQLYFVCNILSIPSPCFQFYLYIPVLTWRRLFNSLFSFSFRIFATFCSWLLKRKTSIALQMNILSNYFFIILSRSFATDADIGSLQTILADDSLCQEIRWKDYTWYMH